MLLRCFGKKALPKDESLVRRDRLGTPMKMLNDRCEGTTIHASQTQEFVFPHSLQTIRAQKKDLACALLFPQKLEQQFNAQGADTSAQERKSHPRSTTYTFGTQVSGRHGKPSCSGSLFLW
jgi:hypothetical protein